MDRPQYLLAGRIAVRRIALSWWAAIIAGLLLTACGGSSAPSTATPIAAGIVQTPIARISSVVAPAVETPIARAQTSVADIPTKIATIIGTPAAQASSLISSVQARSPGVLPKQGACPADHPVKGRLENLRTIYHLPGSADYEQIKPEICFATEADAQAAGFHLPAP